jgi:hypothetical protein
VVRGPPGSVPPAPMPKSASGSLTFALFVRFGMRPFRGKAPLMDGIRNDSDAQFSRFPLPTIFDDSLFLH